MRALGIVPKSGEGVTETNTNDLYRRAAEIFGRYNQCTVALEELSELQKEICKQLRGTGDRWHLAEEIADAKIMIEQLVLLFDVKDRVADIRKQKLLRLERTLESMQGRAVFLGSAHPKATGEPVTRPISREEQEAGDQNCLTCAHFGSPDDDPPCCNCQKAILSSSERYADAPILWEAAQKGESQ